MLVSKQILRLQELLTAHRFSWGSDPRMEVGQQGIRKPEYQMPTNLRRFHDQYYE
jgi:hypothetical protein